jgi:hypothetical protein
MQDKRVAVVEIGGSHDECILSQLHALKHEGCHVTVIATPELIARNPFWNSYVDQYKEIRFPKSAIGDFMLMRDLNHYFEKEGISKVILNTAQGGHIRNLCLTATKKTEFIGIIHTLRKFEGSFTQRIIDRKIKKYLVLNDFFKDRITPGKGIKISSFYPLRFPVFPDTKVNKDPNEKWITVIGGVENRRKDLIGSIDLMLAVRDLPLRFIFLGKSDPNKEEVQYFLQELRSKGLEEKVTLFSDFVSPELFDAYIRKSDLIWTLVHPNTPSAQEYFRNQIPGALNVAFGYKVPMLVHEIYTQEWKDLNSAAPYELKTFREDLKKAFEDLEYLKGEMSNTPKFDPVYQENAYCSFIFDKIS